MTKAYKSKYKTGFVHKPDNKELIFEDVNEVFGAVEPKPLGRMEEVYKSPLDKNIQYQGSWNDCVLAHLSILNQWNSWKYSQNDPFLSHMYLAAQITRYKNGTSIVDALNVLTKKGQCLDDLFPQSKAHTKGKRWAYNKARITKEMDEQAKHFKIQGYTTLRSHNYNTVYQALAKGPLAVGLYIGQNWDKDVIYPSTKYGPHLTTFFDIDDNGDFISIGAFEENKLDVRTLHKSYCNHLLTVKVIQDLPDTLINLKQKRRFIGRLIRTHASPRIFFLDADNRKHYLVNPPTLEDYMGQNAWRYVEVVDEDVLASYAEGLPFDNRGTSLINVIKMLFHL